MQIKYFLCKITFLKQKYQDWQCITFLQISLMSGLIKDSWILLSASAFNLLWCGVLVEIYEEYLASHSYIVWKERGILIPFSGSCNCLKISCSIESEIISLNFLCSVILKCIGLSLLNKSCWNNWTSKCKIMNLNCYTTPHTKINSNWIIDLNMS